MYANPIHRLGEADAKAALTAFDRLAILVTPELQAVHLPLLYDGTCLIGHVARENSVWRAAPCEVLVICPGPEAYISPTWYPSKAQHQRAVPTWNYTTLHVRGHLSTFDDPTSLEDAVSRLSDRHEMRNAQPWHLSDAPRAYVDRLLSAIIGVRIAIDSLEGKAKLSQDRPEADRSAVTAELLASDTLQDRLVGAAMAALS